MNRREFIRSLASASAAGIALGCADGRALTVPRVLLVGDSISFQYGGWFTRALAGLAVVEPMTIPGSASADLTARLRERQALGHFWDVIVANAGLNDFGKMKMNVVQHHAAVIELMAAVASVSARWMWVSTTPTRRPFTNVVLPLANDMARGLCARLGGTYLEGGEFVTALGDEAIRSDALHLTDEAARLLGEYLALEVGQHLRDAENAAQQMNAPAGLQAT